MTKIRKILWNLSWPVLVPLERLGSFSDMKKYHGHWDLHPFSKYSPIYTVLAMGVVIALFVWNRTELGQNIDALAQFLSIPGVIVSTRGIKWFFVVLSWIFGAYIEEAVQDPSMESISSEIIPFVHIQSVILALWIGLMVLV